MIVIANVWHLNRNCEVYGEDTEQFNPTRHLNVDGRVAPGLVDTKDEGHFTYGFGRRI